MVRVATLLLGVFGLILYHCFSFVDTKEVLVVYRFGKIQKIQDAGLEIHFPPPIDRVELLSLRNTHTVELQPQLVLTGDVNLINVHLVAQYDVSNVRDYVLHHKNIDATAQVLLQSALVSVIGHSGVDEERFMKRGELERKITEHVEQQVQKLQLGIEIRNVGFQEVSAPRAVIDAFNDVSSARGERDTVVLSAQSYASKSLPQARGEARKMIEEAQGIATEQLSLAKQRRTRYDDILPVYQSNPKMVVQTLRTQTWSKISSTVITHHLSTDTQIYLPNMIPSGEQP